MHLHGKENFETLFISTIYSFARLSLELKTLMFEKTNFEKKANNHKTDATSTKHKGSRSRLLRTRREDGIEMV